MDAVTIIALAVLCLLAGAFYTGYLVLMARARDSTPQWAVLAWSTLMSALPLFWLPLSAASPSLPVSKPA